ncbi:hypothetical protein [Rhodococcus sp. MS16]|uniref:hypothetical protein n=1 Tax=Rhodococcus sp. MS16 TaxID=2579941 RepID=UPI001561B3DC|nr:hypothetical protein [Rhodococcus sp. MS16]
MIGQLVGVKVATKVDLPLPDAPRIELSGAFDVLEPAADRTDGGQARACVLPTFG